MVQGGKTQAEYSNLIKLRRQIVFGKPEEPAIFRARVLEKRELFRGRAPEICMGFLIRLWLNTKMLMHKVRIQEDSQRRSTRETWSYKLNNFQRLHTRLENFQPAKVKRPC